MTLPIIRNGRLRTPHGTFFWREAGRGPTVLLLHGSWESSHQWASLMAQLGSQYHCVAPDLLGFGESSSLSKQTSTIDTQVTTLQSYLAHLRLTPAVIVADSLGAWVALRYCWQYPDQVQQLILFAPEGISHPLLDRRWRKYRWLASPWALRYWLVKALALPLKALGGDRWLTKIQRRRSQCRAHTTACRLLFQRRQAALNAESLNEVLPQINVPIRLLQPENASETVNVTHQLILQLAPQVQVQPLTGSELTVWENALSQIQVLGKADQPKAFVP